MKKKGEAVYEKQMEMGYCGGNGIYAGAHRLQWRLDGGEYWYGSRWREGGGDRGGEQCF